jgi:hypothetical protein
MPPLEAVCRKTLKEVNLEFKAKSCPKIWVKNYMSDKIGVADSGIITINQPAGLARENII